MPQTETNPITQFFEAYHQCFDSAPNGKEIVESQQTFFSDLASVLKVDPAKDVVLVGEIVDHHMLKKITLVLPLMKYELPNGSYLVVVRDPWQRAVNGLFRKQCTATINSVHSLDPNVLSKLEVGGAIQCARDISELKSWPSEYVSILDHDTPFTDLPSCNDLTKKFSVHVKDFDAMKTLATHFRFIVDHAPKIGGEKAALEAPREEKQVTLPFVPLTLREVEKELTNIVGMKEEALNCFSRYSDDEMKMQAAMAYERLLYMHIKLRTMHNQLQQKK